MKITATVMAHPKRKVQAEYLKAILSYMPFAEVTITYDEINVEWHTGKRALEQGIGKGDWHVVIQDDALLTPFFYENLEGAIKALPCKTLFSLYTGTSRPLGGRVKAAVEKADHASWLRHHMLFWGVGIVIPTAHIKPMLEFVEDIELQYDNKIGEFYCRNGLPVYYCMPSLVDHDDDLGSILGHGVDNPEPRVAHKLATGIVEFNSKEIFI